MSFIFYKLITSSDYKKLEFDGVKLSILDLKKLIFEKAKLKKRDECDLEIKNADTKEVYKNDDLILKNTRVLANRVLKDKVEALKPIDKPSSLGNKVEAITPTVSSTEKSKVAKIQKKASGIPQSFLTEAGSADYGVMLGTNGNYVMHKLDKQAQKIVIKYKNVFLTEEEENKQQIKSDNLTEVFPPYLTCPFTEHGKHLIYDAVLMPCCGSFICCDECILEKISNDAPIKCPLNCEYDIKSLELIESHHEMRKLVNDYLNEKNRNKFDNNITDRADFCLNKKFDSKLMQKTVANENIVSNNTITSDFENKDLFSSTKKSEIHVKETKKSCFVKNDSKIKNPMVDNILPGHPKVNKIPETDSFDQVNLITKEHTSLQKIETILSNNHENSLSLDYYSIASTIYEPQYIAQGDYYNPFIFTPSKITAQQLLNPVLSEKQFNEYKERYQAGEKRKRSISRSVHKRYRSSHEIFMHQNIPQNY